MKVYNPLLLLGFSGLRGGPCAFRRARIHRIPRLRRNRPTAMKNPLDSLLGTVLCGLALTAVLYYLVRSLVGG